MNTHEILGDLAERRALADQLRWQAIVTRMVLIERLADAKRLRNEYREISAKLIEVAWRVNR